jgi:hypothetical protein
VSARCSVNGAGIENALVDRRGLMTVIETLRDIGRGDLAELVYVGRLRELCCSYAGGGSPAVRSIRICGTRTDSPGDGLNSLLCKPTNSSRSNGLVGSSFAPVKVKLGINWAGL